MKRCVDIVFSGLAILIFLLPCTILSFLLVVIDGFPLLFVQARVGKNKSIYKIIKFRTMQDQYVTRTGRWLRSSGLDELPQFINVLKGEMSIVGPRALTPADIQRLGWDDPFHSGRWQVKPGITGMAQLYGGQHRKLSWFWDCWYLKHQYVIVDIIIIACSFLMNVFGKRRVRCWLFQKNNLK